LKKIFLLLRQELKESDIPGRTTMRKEIEKAFQDHLKNLEEEMAVWNVFYFSGKKNTDFAFRNQWGKYPAPLMHGQIWIRYLSWLWLLIGSRPLRKRHQLELLRSFILERTWLDSTKYLGDILVTTLLIVFCLSQITFKSHQK
jgi:hypothetical protein